ncbi:Hpt domain-containing protein [Mesorhizobium microcysteis]|jgi:HPt (histidine-containing phosphotransfer) domain-containing protein|uniref:Hpt domain-containing protein n=1 Tax=Neoaquamicrobium microcysteis TaxID=2682781 RepID=A0A5D4GZC2_9HYPH|nr:Hpt domain-containing protein [Mesorhizobium microcysteis]TYR33738.1 Hpt domain-containing protein [Mesorhizobium microcysteis]
MTPGADETMAFGKPGGETCGRPGARPVDLVHLARQTLGDRALEQEVLELFVQQMISIRERLPLADEAERKMLAHTLKGAARGVGAFAVADCADEIEKTPSSKTHLAKLPGLIDEVRDFVAAINR